MFNLNILVGIVGFEKYFPLFERLGIFKLAKKLSMFTIARTAKASFFHASDFLAKLQQMKILVSDIIISLFYNFLTFPTQPPPGANWIFSDDVLLISRTSCL